MPENNNKAALSKSNPSDRYGRKPRWMSGMAAVILRSKTIEHRRALANNS
ncbi:MAG: hypothetical protein ACKE8G_02605 [Methylophagaceae bacterium]